MKLATVVFLVKNKKIYLAQKKQPIHIEDKKLKNSSDIYNGYGGKFDPDLGDKDIGDTAVRELFEESGGVLIDKKNLENIGVIDFYWPENSTKEADMRVYFYIIKDFTGEPKETMEMCAPEIFDFKDIPYEKMMKADRVFLNKMFDKNNSDLIYKGSVRFTIDSFFEEGEYFVKN